MKIAFYTLGCKVNQYDTEAMEEILLKEGHEIVPFDADADVYIINTCTVTNIADKKSRQMIRKPQKGKIVGVCGCLTQRSGDEVLALDGVTFVFGTKNRAKIGEYIARAAAGETKFNAVEEIRHEHTFETLHIQKTGGRTRAHIKICEGCNNYCSYCIIPYARGPVRSRKLEDIVAEAEVLAKNGVKEVVLTGIHISSYGIDLKNQSLKDVILQLNAVPGIERIRLGSLEPTILTDAFCTSIAQAEKLCPHFHVSLQSGSKGVLLRMNRKYTPEEYKGFIDNVRRHFTDPAITTDIIAGFPGETEEEHQETLRFIKEIGFARIHVFPYSERKGTKAASMPGRIQNAVRKTRAAEIAACAFQMECDYVASFIGKSQNVLLEETVNNMAEGYTERYIKVYTKGNKGEIKRVCPKTVEKNILIDKE